MIFVKHVLFLVFLTASKYFLVPPVSNPLPPLTAINTNTPIRSSQYSPVSCNATNYDLTFIYDESDKAFKMHGLWPEQCAECLTCGYPSCCDTKDVSYVFPSDPEQVAFINTRWFNATTQEECLNVGNNGDMVSLFEHEYFKHASCTAFRQSTSNFVQQVMRLYDEYYAMRVENQCAGYKQLWLNLDGNFAYNNVTKCI
jgi:ribonuclease I